MIILDREMITKESVRPRDYGCQAAFNSDGFLTLRSFDPTDKSKDVLYIFSRRETAAIFNLLRSIRIEGQRDDLPF